MTETMTCLTCYRTWEGNIYPSGRCPYEYYHEDWMHND